MALNLLPKFNQFSKIPRGVLNIINKTLQNPVLITNTLSSEDNINNQISSFNNKSIIAKYNYVNDKGIKDYLDNYKYNKLDWENTSFENKKNVFLNAADLIENKYYDKMLAYTILGQNKNIYEAELDSICELVDFLRYNVYYAEQIINKQPVQTKDISNISEYNSLNGFLASITPFNFTAIGGNLASSPLLFGNSVLWKPSDSAILSNYLFYQIMLEAGLPEGILNFCPMDPQKFLDFTTTSKDLGGILFTGSSEVFDNIYQNVSKNIKNYNSYPRLIGETGGKNFHFVDNSVYNIDDVVIKTIESAFNYSGQKCSACSIVYIHESMLDTFVEKIKKATDKYMVNQENYGVINKQSFDRINNTFNHIKNDDEVEILYNKDTSRKFDNQYHISPKILLCRNHNNFVFNQEFFAPILTIYPYTHNFETMNDSINYNKYALTGSIFSSSYKTISESKDVFRHKTGNFYINDKSTGSVVGQQPFGGSGKSGTNDKAGDINLLYRLFNQRNIKINKII